MEERKIIFIGGNARSLIANRGDLIKELKKNNYKVISFLYSFENEKYLKKLKELGNNNYFIPASNKRVSIISDLKGLFFLVKKIKKIKPDLVFCYNIKPIIFGSLAAKMAKTDEIISMITGLGYIFIGDRLKNRVLKIVTKFLYKISLGYNSKIIFQNNDDLKFFKKNKLVKKNNLFLVNGSGINLERFPFKENIVVDKIKFLFIGRLLHDKGIKEFIGAAKKVKQRNSKVEFHIIGGIDENPSSINYDYLKKEEKEGNIIYRGSTQDVRPFISSSNVVVLPSYREGTPRAILEAMSMGRAVITTDSPGCKETVVEGYNGFLVPIKDIEALAKSMEKFIKNPELLSEMGRNGRELAEEKYDVRKINKKIIEIFES